MTLSNRAFTSLKLPADIQKNLDDLHYEVMTPIQAQSLPKILAGKDVIAQGKTGSGKTAAFALGLLCQLDVKRFCIQALVLCPTRELADQVAREIRRIARTTHNIKVLTLCGGMPFGPQLGSLEHGAHIIVGTPGRIEEHVRKESLRLDQVKCLVLDEADRMLEMGFQPALEVIIKGIPRQRQTLLFSATFPAEIKSIADDIMQSPQLVKVESTHDEASIEQHFYKLTGDEQRLNALRILLLYYQLESTVVFCNTRRETQEVADTLSDFGFSVAALHGEMEQRDRDQTLIRFANKSITVLVATDVAARGLDIDSLDGVINYHLARDPEVHIHRIGRTGRAGGKGLACSLFSEKENYKLDILNENAGHNANFSGESLPRCNVVENRPGKAAMVTLQIDGGKKQKVRPGDILGALTGKQGIPGDAVGKIHIFDQWAFVAVRREMSQAAMEKLGSGKIKGRSFRVRLI